MTKSEKFPSKAKLQIWDPTKKLVSNKGPKLFCFSESLQGANPDHEKPNQDFVHKHEFEWAKSTATVRILADGHGVFGHLVARFVSLEIAAELERKVAELSSLDGANSEIIKSTIAQAFLDINSKLDSSEIDVSVSGCTLTLVMILASFMYIASLGDSKCVLLSKVGTAISITMSTQNHSFDDPNEKQRVEKVGGVVRRIDLNDGEEDGPLRVFKKGFKGPGLAVSRAMGDKEAHALGVICVPGTQL